MSDNQGNHSNPGSETQQSALSKDYNFGGIKEFNLEQIELEVLNDTVYLDVFAGSDMRIKENIVPVEQALEKILQLNGVNFEWKSKGGSSVPKGRQAGLIAQEVAAAMPELVRADRDSGVLAVNYAKMVPYLIEAIKELSERIQVLEAKDGGKI